jgi:hypothetical protein
VKKNKNITELSIDLESCKQKIRNIECDLKKNLNPDLDENALEEEDREILNQLYNIEIEKAKKIELELFNL